MRVDMLKKLEDKIKELKRVAIAYSGGIDSSFLVFVANKVLLKENVLAIIANGNMMSKQDYNEAIKFLKENNFNYIEMEFKPLDVIQFRENNKDRCYYCKKSIMTKIKDVAKKLGFNFVLDGKNLDDFKVYRPGNKITEELNILSPLADIGFDKQMIRNNAKEIGIKIWNKPSNSCLATRFPYNTILTNEKLKKVELGEEIIKRLGIKKVRMRVHDELVRIEIEREDFETICRNQSELEKIEELGFKFVTLDLMGIKSGSFD